MSRIVIIGGGAIGLSVAYHLAKRGAQDVVLLERNQLTSGTSWHAAGIVGPLRATPNMTRLASYALELFPRLETETGMSTGYRRTGGYWLARRPERLDELNRIASLGRTQGLKPRMIATGDVAVPQLELKNHVGALHVPEDGNVNPVDLCMAYARAARWMGVDIRENTGVQDLLVSDGRAAGVVLADRSKLLADTVILCTGAWSRELAARAGIKLPLQAVEHMYVVTEPMPGLPDPFPVIRDLDTGIYIKGDTGKLVIGGFEPDAKCWNAYGQEGDRPFLELAEDWDQFAPFMDAALDLVPSLANTGIQHFMNGPESFTTDTRPLVGETPTVDGLFVAAGMNSVGIMSSAGIGKALADWVIDGQPRNDLWEVDVARTDPRAASSEHMAARMSEAVSDLFAMHWPFKQPTAGRKLRTSPLHKCWAEQGAVFGVTAGWERGLWYAQGPAELDLPYSVGEQSWYPIVRREAARMTNGAALIDLTPFTKLRLSGPSALVGLNYLSSAQLDVPVNKTVYTQFMNSRGGIEMDVTVTRIASDSFDITSGAATRWRDLGWLRRNLPSDVDIADLTDDSCVIGLMGPASRNILTALCTDWPDISFGHAADISIAGLPVRATRISYVGELGWELRVGNSDAKVLFSKLLESEAVPMGHYALDACRIEKGYRHWGHDIGPDLTPLEAGLGFTMDWTKDSIAKQALRQQRDNGVTRRLILMQIEGDPLILHDEPIFENETYIGLTTSGGVGARTGLTLAFGLISTSPNETLAQICERRFQVEVAGQRYRATPLARPPYDPDNRRMRA